MMLSRINVKPLQAMYELKTTFPKHQNAGMTDYTYKHHACSPSPCPSSLSAEDLQVRFDLQTSIHRLGIAEHPNVYFLDVV